MSSLMTPSSAREIGYFNGDKDNHTLWKGLSPNGETFCSSITVSNPNIGEITTVWWPLTSAFHTVQKSAFTYSFWFQILAKAEGLLIAHFIVCFSPNVLSKLCASLWTTITNYSHGSYPVINGRGRNTLHIPACHRAHTLGWFIVSHQPNENEGIPGTMNTGLSLMINCAEDFCQRGLVFQGLRKLQFSAVECSR